MIEGRWVVCLWAMGLVFVLFVGVCVAVDPAVAEESLNRAEDDLSSAYVAVAEAERAGANVSELMAKLELAGDMLASARNLFGTGDYDGAFSGASNCSAAVGGVVSEAAALKLRAEQARVERLFLTAGLSSAGLCLLFVAGMFFWRFLRGWHVRRVLRMKPEVGNDA